MNRLAFLRRMALAAAACAFIDVPWPKEVVVPLRRDQRAMLCDYNEGDTVVETWFWMPENKAWHYKLRHIDGRTLSESWQPDVPFVVHWT